MKHALKGALVAVSADNLASQAIGGYKALYSAFQKCRQCMATSDTMQTKVGLKKLISVITF